MGILSWIKNTFGRIFSRKKEKEIEKKEEPIVKDTITEKSTDEIKEEIKKEEKDIKEIDRELSKIKESTPIRTDRQIVSQKEETRQKTIYEKIVTKYKDFERLTPSTREYYSKLLNSDGNLINLGVFNNEESLRAEKFNIYRNIIMRAIKDDSVAQKIYQSGLLDNHIMGYIIIKGIVLKGRGINTVEIVFDVQGLTPDKALAHNLINNLIGSEIELTSIRNYLNKINGVTVSQANTIKGRLDFNSSNVMVKIDSIQIKFDFV